MSLSIGMLVYSFAYTTVNNIGENVNYLAVSEILFNFKESVESIKLDNQVPTIDKFGLLSEPFTFSISNDGNEEASYTIRLVDKGITSTINNTNMRYQVKINDIEGEPRDLLENGVIDSGMMPGNTTYNYELRIWLANESSQLNSIWNKVIKVEAGTTNIDDSGANRPKLTDGLIPVYYDNNNNVWRKADSTNSNINYMWYDYSTRIWANAVTVKTTNRDDYVKAVPGTEIKIDDINSMWVWIPRYKYVVFNAKGDDVNPINIKVTFEKGNRSTSSVVCKENVCYDQDYSVVTSGKSTYSPQAFTFGEEELTGIWVAKFAASADSETSCYKEPSTNTCNVSSLNINIRPNANLLSNVSLANLFANFRRMEAKDNIFGFKGTGGKVNSDGTITGDTNDIDIHMIKNSEWDAVVYLYHSQYGKYGDSTYTNKEIYLNPGSISGTSYGDSIGSDKVYKYDTMNYGMGASTTGNIYGVYDLNTTQETVVMANVSSDKFVTTNKEGFKEPYPEEVYYDIIDRDSFGKNVYSGSFETRKWYRDSYTTNTGNLITRGNNLTNETNGVFGINVGVSANINKWNSRPVLKVEDTIYITKW